VPYGADFCVLSRRADGVPVVQALHLANPGFSRIPQATCIKLAKQHMELYKIVNYIRRSGDKQSSADLIGMCGYRIPMGQGVFGRYNDGGKAEELADAIIDEEWPRLLQFFSTAYRQCMAYVSSTRKGNTLAAVMGTSVFTAKSVTLKYDPNLHIDQHDYQHGWVLHYEHLGPGNTVVGGGFYLTNSLTYQPTSGSMLYLRADTLPHRSYSGSTLLGNSNEGRYGTALFINKKCLSNSEYRQQIFDSHMEAHFENGTYRKGLIEEAHDACLQWMQSQKQP
jgi:hypothetical protein